MTEATDYDVFLSYSAHDKQWVDELVAELHEKTEGLARRRTPLRSRETSRTQVRLECFTYRNRATS